MNYERIISATDSAHFAVLSGDRNPIHSDPIAAGRLPYGTTIVHGVHTLCVGLDTWCRQQIAPVTLTSLTADFSKPVFFGDVVQISFNVEDLKVVLRAKTDGNAVIRAHCLCADNLRPPARTSSSLPAVEIAASWNRTRLLSAAGSVTVMADPYIAGQLFPDFIRVLGLDTLALFLATSRIVGMKCPGTNSLFTSLQLAFDPNRIAADVLNFRAGGFDSRFNILDVNLWADGVTGGAQCHLLPAPE
jgi:MaoC like domain